MSLWHDPAPLHFDLRLPWWLKSLLVLAATLLALVFFDQPLAQFCRAHRLPDLAQQSHGDVARELMFLEQYGQFSCTVIAVFAVGLMDPKGRRRALAIAMACLLTFVFTYLLKELAGRSRPFNSEVPGFAAGHWLWRGPSWDFFDGSAWGSFPSAHTTAAFALASSLAWFYPRGRPLFMTLATITAAQRVCHNAHYLSDVLAGMGIGVFFARMTLAQKLPGRLIALGLPVVQRWWLRDRP
jgi:membrane-associated phospholipid phosphatase